MVRVRCVPPGVAWVRKPAQEGVRARLWAIASRVADHACSPDTDYVTEDARGFRRTVSAPDGPHAVRLLGLVREVHVSGPRDQRVARIAPPPRRPDRPRLAALIAPPALTPPSHG